MESKLRVSVAYENEDYVLKEIVNRSSAIYNYRILRMLWFYILLERTQNLLDAECTFSKVFEI